MILGIGTEAGIFLYAGLSGMTVMFAYELLCCLRKLIPHVPRVVAAEDFLFWIGTIGVRNLPFKKGDCNIEKYIDHKDEQCHSCE